MKRTIKIKNYTIEINQQKDKTYKTTLYLNGVYCSCSQNHFLTERELNEYLGGYFG